MYVFARACVCVSVLCSYQYACRYLLGLHHSVVASGAFTFVLVFYAFSHLSSFVLLLPGSS